MNYVAKWDALTVNQRIVLLNRAMPGERWSDLRQRMAGTEGRNLTPIQQEALQEIIAPAPVRRARRRR